MSSTRGMPLPHLSVPRAIWAVVLVGALALAATASASDSPPGAAPPPGQPDTTLVTQLEPDEAAAVGAAVNAFGWDLLQELASEGESTVTSPLSVAVLLAMVLAGAGGDTAEAMADVLHLEDARDGRVRELLGALTDTEDVTLSVANALWANDGTPFESDYLTFVRDVFGATADEADLGDPATAEEIDAWVHEHTEGLIDGIAEDLGLPDPAAVLVLVNAVYFLGEWTTQFDPAATVDLPFTLPDGQQVDVPLMHLRDEPFEYAERDGYQLLRLPYGDKDGDQRYGMEVLLPDPGTGVTELVQELDADEWQAGVDSLTEQPVQELALPTFELEWDAALNDSLTALGMGPAFDPDADFRPMSEADPWLGSVVHKTYLRVDEEGTEAAAVTGGEMTTSAPLDPLVFRVDRPFAFTISDRETGTVLFLGTVTDPR